LPRKFSTQIAHLAAGLAAVSMVATAGVASADPRGRYDRHHHRDNNKAETAIVAGVLGLAIGAAIAGGTRDNDRYERSDRGYGYGYGYAPPPPPRYYGRGYSEDCWTTRDYDRRSGVVYERTVCR
jgi:hypothetical protein